MWIYFLPRVLDFNPRPREEGDSFHCLYYTAPLYFNPRPREEGDKLSCDSIKFNKNISIHALVKRATQANTKNLKRHHISIHALVKRATSFHCLYYNVPLYFNPRPREEGD